MYKKDNNMDSEEGKDMQAIPKEKGYKGLSLSPKKLEEITIKPIVKDGKLLFDKNNKDHRYIVEEGEY
ncbi:MAG: hypothetical protein P4L49_04880 [Desulfosporosinus sp.]|nr:hypothetical protein [Desulfosporosinus sp.]